MMLFWQFTPRRLCDTPFPTSCLSKSIIVHCCHLRVRILNLSPVSFLCFSLFGSCSPCDGMLRYPVHPALDCPAYIAIGVMTTYTKHKFCGYVKVLCSMTLVFANFCVTRFALGVSPQPLCTSRPRQCML